MELAQLLDEYSDVQNLSEEKYVRRAIALQKLASSLIDDACRILRGESHWEVDLILWMRRR